MPTPTDTVTPLVCERLMVCLVDMLGISLSVAYCGTPPQEEHGPNVQFFKNLEDNVQGNRGNGLDLSHLTWGDAKLLLEATMKKAQEILDK
jgi:hypothetical protein